MVSCQTMIFCCIHHIAIYCLHVLHKPFLDDPATDLSCYGLTYPMVDLARFWGVYPLVMHHFTVCAMASMAMLNKDRLR